MRSICLEILVIALVGQSTGCHRHAAGGDVQAELTPLENIFGVRWPTNRLKQYAASLNYRAALDGNSKNNEIIARLEVDSSVFASWRQSVTNTLERFEGIRVPVDVRLTRQVPVVESTRISRVSSQPICRRNR
jgi:hypothetical protein